MTLTFARARHSPEWDSVTGSTAGRWSFPGGEQQRVAVARALAGKPRIVWADEPTGNLDSEMAAAVMELLGELHAEGLSIILVTHDPTVAAHSDRLITVRDGRLVGDEQLGANGRKRDEKARELVLS